MLLYHFTSQASANSVVEGIHRFPFYLTTDLKHGTAYGSYAAVFKVEGEFKCQLSRVAGNRKTNGMVQYVIRNQEELRSFMLVVQASGVRHCELLRRR